MSFWTEVLPMVREEMLQTKVLGKTCPIVQINVNSLRFKPASPSTGQGPGAVNKDRGKNNYKRPKSTGFRTVSKTTQLGFVSNPFLPSMARDERSQVKAGGTILYKILVNG